ncbi:MAG: hypothetical protein U5N86_03235 [Planctomycetota bacterium]|nr:hypothetical protein [Planctomycetota bacterium]
MPKTERTAMGLNDRDLKGKRPRFVHFSNDLLDLFEAPQITEEPSPSCKAARTRNLGWCKRLWDEVLFADERRAMEYFMLGCDMEQISALCGVELKTAAKTVARAVVVARLVRQTSLNKRFAQLGRRTAKLAKKVNRGSPPRLTQKHRSAVIQVLNLACARFYVPPSISEEAMRALHRFFEGAELSDEEREVLGKALEKTAWTVANREGFFELFTKSTERTRTLLHPSKKEVEAVARELAR